jgi:hypothetical protein
MNNEISVSIPANGVSVVVVGEASVFFCIATNGTFKVRPDNRDRVTVSQAGKKFGNPGAHPFNKLTFYNSTAAVVTATVWVGEEEYSDQNTTVTNSVSTTFGNDIANCIDAVPSQFLKISNAAAAPVALAAAGTKFRWALLLGCKAQDSTANAGSVFVGALGGAGQQPIEVFAGTAYVLPVPQGAKWDFGNWFLKVANDGDGLVVIYT